MIGFRVERGYYTGLSCDWFWGGERLLHRTDCDWFWGGERLLHRTEL